MPRMVYHFVHPGRTYRPGSLHLRKRFVVLLWTLIFLVQSVNVSQVVQATTAGIPFTEPFDEDNLKDALLTNANWSTEDEALFLAWRQARLGAFGPASVGSDIPSDIPADSDDTLGVALGDVDGDGDLDIVVGNQSLVNRLYMASDL